LTYINQSSGRSESTTAGSASATVLDWNSYLWARELADDYGLPLVSLEGCNTYESILIQEDISARDPNYRRASVVNRGENQIWLNWNFYANIVEGRDLQAESEEEETVKFPRTLEDAADTEMIASCALAVMTSQWGSYLPHLPGHNALNRYGGANGQPVDTGIRLGVRRGEVLWDRAGRALTPEGIGIGYRDGSVVFKNVDDLHTFLPGAESNRHYLYDPQR